MATTAISRDTLPSINPASGEIVAHFESTPPAFLPDILKRARMAQQAWSQVPVSERCGYLRALQECILARREELAGLIVRETGRHQVGAQFVGRFRPLDAASYYPRNDEKLLLAEHVPHHSTAAKEKSSKRQFAPIGVSGAIPS